MQIATRFGFHRTTVARYLKQAGETLRTDPRPCLPGAGPAGLHRDRDGQAHRTATGHQQGLGAEGGAGISEPGRFSPR